MYTQKAIKMHWFCDQLFWLHNWLVVNLDYAFDYINGDNIKLLYVSLLQFMKNLWQNLALFIYKVICLPD